MGRKSLTGEKESKYAKFRVDSEVQAILEDLKRQGVNISEFIRDLIKNPDTAILKRFLIPFFDQGIEVDLDDNMIPRIQELWKEVKLDA